MLGSKIANVSRNLEIARDALRRDLVRIKSSGVTGVTGDKSVSRSLSSTTRSRASEKSGMSAKSRTHPAPRNSPTVLPFICAFFLAGYSSGGNSEARILEFQGGVSRDFCKIHFRTSRGRRELFVASTRANYTEYNS